MNFAHANIVSILIAAVAAWIFGGVYYTALSKPWLAAQGKTLLVTTHDLRCNMEYFDGLLALNRQLVALGPVERVLTPDILTRTYGTQIVLADGTSVALT